MIISFKNRNGTSLFTKKENEHTKAIKKFTNYERTWTAKNFTKY